MLVFKNGVLTSATMLAVESQQIRTIHVVRNPEKLRHALHATAAIV